MRTIKRFDVVSFRVALDQKREAEGLTVRQLAALTGVSTATLIRVGKGRVPDVDGFALLVEWLGGGADHFLGVKVEGCPSCRQLGAALNHIEETALKLADIAEVTKSKLS